jgi:hypothetical protein
MDSFTAWMIIISFSSSRTLYFLIKVIQHQTNRHPTPADKPTRMQEWKNFHPAMSELKTDILLLKDWALRW